MREDRHRTGRAGARPLPAGRIVSGQVLFQGRDLLRASRREMRDIRGREIAMVFQDPQSSLNPVFTIGQQIAAVLRAHNRMPAVAIRRRVVELLEMVGVPDAAARAGDYPHQWSGGMCQRAMIAMAMSNSPKLLIADEPTTALDVTVQAQVLDVLMEAQRTTGAATMLITHDLAVVAELAQRVVVMYSGRVAETGPVDSIFRSPSHPYTLGLMASLPRLDRDLRQLDPIPGQPPSLLDVPSGCAFHPRCRLRRGRERCVDEVPALLDVGDSRQESACHFRSEMPEEIDHVGAEMGVDLRARQP